MAQTLREADDIEAARLASGKLVFVGYMRRYATAFLRFKEAVGELNPADINYGRALFQKVSIADSNSPVSQLHVKGE
jgi:predicted dehydrogenase